MLISFLLILIGLLLLLIGGHFLVTSSVGIALHYKVSTMVIGLTLVSFATSAPELLVSSVAAFNGHTDIAIGNIFGSNVANIGLILGITAALYVLPVAKKTYYKDWLFLTFITGLLFVFLYTKHTLHWYEGAILVAILVYFNIQKIRRSRNSSSKEIEGELDMESGNKPMWRLIIELVVGVIGLKFGAEFLVNGSVDVAIEYNISERVISLSMVALGTSLPEMAASLIAAKKKHKDLAVGNIIGSNIFNILGVLGLTSFIKDIPISPETLKFDYWWVFGFTFILYPLIRMFRGKDAELRIGRKEGIVLFFAYVVYMILIFTLS